MQPNLLNKKQIKQFQDLILDWYAKNQRDLPWRKTHDAYQVMVSEVMLQQTQVDRVLKYWTQWIERWPTFEALATAQTRDVIHAWAGLGYNRRAVNLQRSARIITNELHGHFPEKLEEIQKLPGIGQGTAGALMNFVWNVDTPFLEVNIKRIFQRLAFGPETILVWAKDRELLELAHALLPAGQARIWPHALMDFGALACRPNDPFCTNCPLGKLVEKRNRTLDREYKVARSMYHEGKFQSHNPKYILLPTTPTPEPFVGSNRYWRGRIIDVLRHNSELISHQSLYGTLPNADELDPNRFEKLLADLTKDGLVVTSKGKIGLPTN